LEGLNQTPVAFFGHRIFRPLRRSANHNRNFRAFRQRQPVFNNNHTVMYATANDHPAIFGWFDREGKFHGAAVRGNSAATSRRSTGSRNLAN